MPSKTCVEITINSPAYSVVTKGKKTVKICLSYTETFAKQGRYCKEIKQYKKSFLKGNEFYTGFVPFIEGYCKLNKIDCKVINEIEDIHLEPENEPFVEGAVLDSGKYGFQYGLIKKCIKHQRGVIKSATGSGKTVMILGLISCYPSSKIAFVSKSKTPLMNFRMECEERGIFPTNVTLSTIQSLYKKPDEAEKFDIILIDECDDGMGTPTGMYQQLLTNVTIPMRIGFTGSLPDTEAGKLTLAGLLGPVLGELTIQEGHERGILTKPKIIVKMIPENASLKNAKTYQEAYKKGVVNNRALNSQIVEDINEAYCNKESALVLITEIEHGKNIQEMAKRLYNLDLKFVFGGTEMDMRVKIARLLGDKKVDGVIATNVFKRALNIPSLDHVFLGFGGKCKTGLLQAIGRGLRTAEDKEITKIHDYFNPSHKHLIKHFGHRLCVYFEEGWL